MKTFKAYFDQKMRNTVFKDLYDQECHVCATTVCILNKLEACNQSLEKIASQLGVDVHQLTDLRKADYCDPHLVVRLCELVGEPIPQACPRRS